MKIELIRFLVPALGRKPSLVERILIFTIGGSNR